MAHAEMTLPPQVERTIDVAAAVNSQAVLDNCLRRSPDVSSGALKLRTYEGFSSASRAYNAALSDTSADVLILAHQDVYLPAGFLSGFQDQLRKLEAIDPNWAIAGVMGLDAEGGLHGRTWSSGLGHTVGDAPEQPMPIATLDEMLIVVRCASGVRFDEALPGFHLYAADAVQAAKTRGQLSYVIDAPVIHHSRPVVALDAGYRQAYRYMQRKWWDALPIPNLVCPIRRSSLTLWFRDARIRRRHHGKPRPADPKDNPALIARRLGFETVAEA